jgi:hypothetical protein
MGTSQQSWTRVMAILSPLVAAVSGLGSVKSFPTLMVLTNRAITTPLHYAGIT